MNAIRKYFLHAVKVRESSLALLVGVSGVVSRPESLVGREFYPPCLEYVSVGGFFQPSFV